MSSQHNPAWVPVSSSALSAIAYDAGTQSLYVRFTQGTEYVYSNVTQDEHAALITAGSIGRAFNQTIKHTHPYHQITHNKSEDAGGGEG